MRTFLLIDLETSGYSYYDDGEIIEVGVIDVSSKSLGTETRHLLNMHGNMHWAAMKKHGYKKKDLEGNPYFSDIALKLSNLLDDSVLIGHNIESFDIPFIISQFHINNVKIPLNLQYIDTLQYFKKGKFLKSYSLDSLSEYYNIPPRENHTAIGDCKLLWQVIQRFRQQFPTIEPSIKNVSSAMINKILKRIGATAEDLAAYSNTSQESNINTKKISTSQDILAVPYSLIKAYLEVSCDRWISYQAIAEALNMRSCYDNFLAHDPKSSIGNIILRCKFRSQGYVTKRIKFKFALLADPSTTINKAIQFITTPDNVHQIIKNEHVLFELQKAYYSEDFTNYFFVERIDEDVATS